MCIGNMDMNIKFHLNIYLWACISLMEQERVEGSKNLDI